MKVLQINSVCGIRSTGRIVSDIAERLIAEGHECRIAFGRATLPEKYRKIAYRIGTDFDVCVNGARARVFDNEGFNAKRATKKFLKWATDYNPDVVWLHNLHGYYINVELLFDWIKSRPNMTVRWTLHDCWAFTGHCTHFTVAHCDQWERHCMKCLQSNRYPAAYKDNSQRNFRRKEAAFLGVANMTLITPSRWLAELVGKSFLKGYSIEVIYNAVDTTVFTPTPGDFQERFHIADKKLVLGVASAWTDRKGLGDFFELADMLDERFVIILVGLTKKQIKNLPPNIIGIGKTDSAKELAEIYTAADVLVNPTYEDNFPTVNIEAQACGTPGITYRTGGSPECFDDTCGSVVECGDIGAMKEEIIRICEQKPYSMEACLKRSRLFSKTGAMPVELTGKSPEGVRGDAGIN